MAPPETASPPVVMVVEDEVIVRLGIASHLRDAGFRVVEAASGAEAQTLIMTGIEVDLVFSDVNMSGGDGISLARWLAENNVAAPVILTSGLPYILDQARESCPNVRTFVTKPYDEQRLIQQMRALLSSQA